MLSSLKIVMLVFVAFIIATGQVLFKLAAQKIAWQGTWVELAASAFNGTLLGGLILYGVAAVLWIYLLSEIPLSRAYPFVVLSFAFVPMLSALVLNEHIGIGYGMGMVLIFAGLFLVLR